MVKVELELYDVTEVEGFAQFWKQVESYRAKAAQQYAAQAQAAAAPDIVAGVAEARYEAEPAPDAAVVGSITPKDGTPTDGDMNQAATAFLRKQGSSTGAKKLLEWMKEYGANKLPDVPAEKRAELLAKLVEGAK